MLEFGPNIVRLALRFTPLTNILAPGEESQVRVPLAATDWVDNQLSLAH